MPKCRVTLDLGTPPEEAPGRWIEASISIEGPAAFDFEAQLFERCEAGTLSMRHVASRVDGPFTAETLLALLTLCSAPPFTPTGDCLDICVDGDRWLAEGALARLGDKSIKLEVTPRAIPLRSRNSLIEQMAAARTAKRMQRLLGAPGFG